VVGRSKLSRTRLFIMTAQAMVGLLYFGLGRAEESHSTEAQRLADAAFTERQKGDGLATGSEAAYEKGIELAKRAIEIDPSLADGYYALFENLGRKSERAGVGAQAMHVAELKRLLDKTLELDPSHARAWEAKGEMLIRLPWLLGGSDAEGRKALERSAALDPKWPKPVLRLAQDDWKHGHAAEARAGARRARELAQAAGDEKSTKEADDLLKEIEKTR
jgi:tetratricopeptide (TPR) repeat protein